MPARRVRLCRCTVAGVACSSFQRSLSAVPPSSNGRMSVLQHKRCGGCVALCRCRWVSRVETSRVSPCSVPPLVSLVVLFRVRCAFRAVPSRAAVCCMFSPALVLRFCVGLCSDSSSKKRAQDEKRLETAALACCLLCCCFCITQYQQLSVSRHHPAALTMLHFINCMLLTFAPHVIAYKATRL